MYKPEPRPPGGPPQNVRWLAFAGWLILPIALTWAIVALTGVFVLWWGVIWTVFAVSYTVAYFRWAKRAYPKDGNS